MNFIGIDASLTHTGIAVHRDGEDLVDAWKPGKLRGTERLAWFREKFIDLFHEQPCVVALEGYSFGSRNSHSHSAGELGGVIRLAAYDMGVDLMAGFLVVPPSTLKKYATGKGNADKSVMLLHAYKRWGVEFTDHNICDAYALMRFARDAYAPDERKTKALRALLAKVVSEDATGIVAH